METMCSVLLGKAKAKGNGCGQTIVLERGEESKARSREDREGEAGGEKKVKHFSELSLNRLPVNACTHTYVHTQTKKCITVRCSS